MLWVECLSVQFPIAGRANRPGGFAALAATPGHETFFNWRPAAVRHRIHHVAAILAWVLAHLLAHNQAVVDEQANIENEKYDAQNYQVSAHHVIALSVCLEGHHS